MNDEEYERFVEYRMNGEEGNLEDGFDDMLRDYWIAVETYEPPPQPEQLLWAAVDFDGTLCESTWTVETPHAPPGPPIERNVRKLNELVERGMKIAIHTSRSWADYSLIEHWMNHHKIHFDRIVCGKLLARVYVDDRSVFSEDDSWWREG